MLGLVAVLMLLAGGGLAWRLRKARQASQALTDRCLAIWDRSPPEARVEQLERFAGEPDRSATAWYLLGVGHVQARRFGQAARCFGMAFHGDARLGSAALLAFTSLKTAADGPEGTLSIESFWRRLLVTWDEMQRPEVLADSFERRLVGALADGSAGMAGELTPLGRLVWAVSTAEDRRQLSAMASAAREPLGALFARE